MLIPIRDLNPTRRFAIVTVVIIAINVLVYIATTHSIIGSLGPVEAYKYGAVACDVFHRCANIDPQVAQILATRSPMYSIFTSMFMHANLFHIGFNMLFLWVFGNNVEDRLGRVLFPIFYLACGFAASFAQLLANPSSTVPNVGASGAISGVLGAYAILWPTATIISLVPLGFFFFSVRLRAWIVLGLWFVLQLIGGSVVSGDTTQGGGVAYLAHVGGFVAGMLLIIPFGGRRSVREQPP